jgi:5-methylcytosine-specific restriction endonuclease McrA
VQVDGAIHTTAYEGGLAGTVPGTGPTTASHACVIGKTFADGIGRCPCGQWWRAVPAQSLVRAELRERMDDHKRQIGQRRARDLRDAVRQAAARDLATRSRRHGRARMRWHMQQAGKEVRWWRVVRLIIIADPCAYCGAEATVVDHIRPRSRGGSSKRRNLAPACKPCNSAKRDRTPEEWKAARMARGLSWPPAPWLEAAAPAA